mgnify:CR=1 FL=1|jgi:hypothetical protein
MRKMLAVPNLAVPDQQAGAALPRDVGEPVFSEPWQAHTFAVVMSLYRDGHYNWAEWDDYLGYHIQAPGHFGGAASEADDATADNAPDGAEVAGDRANYSRFLADCEADGARYYHLWQAAAEQLLDAMGLVPKAELEARITAFAKAEREGARFGAGQRVLVRDIKREGHTHLPLYLRGKTGEIESDRGLYVFPKAVGHGHDHGDQTHRHDHGDNDTLQHVYCVRFASSDIWEGNAAGHSLNFNLWDYQLEPA